MDSALRLLIVSFVIAQTRRCGDALPARRGVNHEIQEVQLARDLYREFYDKDKNYLQVANAIEGCQKLYKDDGGKFSHLQINEYLGFFADLGLFMEHGAS